MRSAIGVMGEAPSNMVPDVSKDWLLWCRLCAKADIQNVNIFLKDEEMAKTAGTIDHNERGLKRAISRYFNVELNPEEQLPIKLCKDCFLLITSLIKFNERVIKVQQMYFVLHTKAETDLPAFRLKHGILEIEQPHHFMNRSITEIQSFEQTIKAHKQPEKGFGEPADGEITLQQHHNGIEIKRENSNDIALLTDEDVCDFENEDAVDEDPFESDLEFYNEERKEIRHKTKNIPIQRDNDIKLVTSSPNMEIKRNEFIGTNNGNTTKRSIKREKTIKHLKVATTDFEENKKEKPYTCIECSKVFKIFAFYRSHMKRKHAIFNIAQQFVCTECPSSFNTQTQLSYHTIKHLPITDRRIVPCPCCEKKFSTKITMERHIKFVHMNERSFICEECGEAVHTKDQLKQHMLTHSDYAPFECEDCKKCFKNRQRLKEHMESHNTNKHVCDECGLQLNSRTTLTRHLLVHSDVMQHKCDYCGRAFKRAKALKNHLILHTGLKPYSCDFCDRTFANGSNCRSHKRKSHPKELAAQEASGGKTYTKNIPKLALLKSVTQAAENLAPVVSKQSGNFAFGKKYKHSSDSIDIIKRKEKLPN